MSGLGEIEVLMDGDDSRLTDFPCRPGNREMVFQADVAICAGEAVAIRVRAAWQDTAGSG